MEVPLTKARLIKSLAVAGIAALSALPASAQQLTMLCAPTAQWCEAIAAAFERDTGIKVGMARKSAGEILAQVKAEAQNPRTDIWFGGSAETHMVAAEQGFLQAYTSPNMKDLHPWAIKVHEQSGGQAVGVSSGAIALVINKELAAKKGFKLPEDWDGLLDPVFRNELQMPNPMSSGTAYTIIAGLIQLWDEDRAFDYLKKLHANVNAYTRSGAAPLRAVSRGEAGGAISFSMETQSDIEKGFPIAFGYPKSGTSYEVASVSIIKGSRNLVSAKKFYDWYLTGAAQDIGIAVGEFHIPAHKGAKSDPRLPDLSKIKLVDYDFKKFGSSEMRKRILERWEREIGSLPANR